MYNNYPREDWKKFNNAIYNTAVAHSKDQAIGALKKLMINKDSNSFTRANDSRKNVDELGPEQIKDMVIQRYIELILESPDEENNPLEKAIKTTYYKYEKDPERDENELIRLLLKQCVEKNINRFTRDGNAREDLDKYLDFADVKLSEIVTYLISEKVAENIISKQEKYFDSTINISNVCSYPDNIERLRSEIISGIRMKREGTISLGKELQACSSIGNIRKNQEDAVLLIRHPLNPEFKMMVVADGVGGLEVGEKASDIVVSEMKKWFETLEISYFENMEGIEENLGQALNIISKQVGEELSGRGASTFVGAIIGKNETLISNVGDSRAYTLAGTNLQEITEDQSIVRRLYEQGIIKHLEDMRFHKDSYKITQALSGRTVRPNFYTLENGTYDAIMLFSDGVTDCLSDDQIFAITRSTDRTKLAEAIVRGALTTTSIKPSELDDDYVSVITAGKDNTTAAVYLNENRRMHERNLEKSHEEPGAQSAKSVRMVMRDGTVVMVNDEKEGFDDGLQI